MEGDMPATDAGSAPQGESQTPPPAPEPRKHKVKVYDQEMEVDDETLKRDYELRQASHVRMQKAAELEKQWKDKEAKYKQDPWALMQELGLDPDQAAEERLLKKLEFDMLSPEQKELQREKAAIAKDKAEIDAAKAAKAEWEAGLEKEKQDKLTYEAVQQIDSEIGEILQATGLKPSRRVIARVAEVMLSYLDSNEDGERLDAASAFGRVQEEMSQDIGDYLENLPIEKAVETLPKPFLDALRKFFLKQAQEQDPVMRGREARTQTNAGSTPQKRRVTSTDSFFDRLDKKLK